MAVWEEQVIQVAIEATRAVDKSTLPLVILSCINLQVIEFRLFDGLHVRRPTGTPDQ